MKTVSRIDGRTVTLALEILDRQKTVPQSPAAYDDGGHLCLCAAGILANAGLMMTRPLEDVDVYWSDIALTKNKSRLFEAFRLLGWSSELCKEVISENDRSDPSVRRAVVAARFANLVNGQIHSG